MPVAYPSTLTTSGNTVFFTWSMYELIFFRLMLFQDLTRQLHKSSWILGPSLLMSPFIRAQYQRLKWASNSPYIGAMMIRGVLTACRRLFERRQKKLQKANNLLHYISSHDSTTNTPYPPGTLIEEDENVSTFEEWLAL